MSKLTPISRRFLRESNPVSMASELDHLASEFIDNGWEIKRGVAGIVVLTLEDGEVHFVPTGKGIEEIIFKKLS
ncbi:MAG: hypothetical protein GX992_00540 [Clostridium sp.]|nr:hypothetical protein [Clostridium sp.]